MSILKKIKGVSLSAQIFIALIVGALLGMLLQDHVAFLQAYVAPIGTIFLNLLKFIVVPLVLVSIICGIISTSDISKVGRLGLRALIYFVTTTAIAVTLGLSLSTYVADWFPKFEITGIAETAVPSHSLMDQIVECFPKNAFEPLVNSSMMQIIVIALFVGYAMVKVGDKAKPLHDLIVSTNEVVTAILGIIMSLTPIGVFCIIAPVVAVNGASIFGGYAALIAIAYGIFLIHMLLVYTPAVYLLGRVNPLLFFKRMAPAMLFGYSCDSSVATLPVSMRCVESLGVPKTVSNFVMPLGATLNMDGVAIYLGVTSVFIAGCSGMDLTMSQYVSLALAATIASIGTPAIPGGSLALMAMVFSTAGIPIEGVTIVAGVDRIVDMARTTMSVTGDASCAVVVNRFEKKNSPQNADSQNETIENQQ